MTSKNPSNRRISDETLLKYKLKPYSSRKGHTHWTNIADIKGVKLGRFLFENTRVILKINGEEVFSLIQVDEDFPVMGINAKFFDYNGRKTLEVRGNIVRGEVDSWDLQSAGNLITINNAPGDIVLSIRLGNNGIIEIERLKMNYLGGEVEIRPDGSITTSFEGKLRVKTIEARVMNADVGIDLKDGVLSFGRAERTIFARGASDINFRPSRSRPCDTPDDKSNGASSSQTGHSSRKLDFSGMAAGVKVNIEGLEYSGGLTPIEIDRNSISVGVAHEDGGGDNSMYIEKLRMSKS